jgi:ABC-type dipeptide/oligopeptide/nickel transport system permease component
MWVYITRRLLLLIPVIVGVMTITFLIVSALPISDRLVSCCGEPKGGWHATANCATVGAPKPWPASGQCPNPPYVAALNRLGLNRPIPVQWAIYIGNSLTGNWGTTDAHSEASDFFGLSSALPVTTVLSWYLPYTLELAIFALLLIIILSFPIGNYAAVYRNRPFDQGARIWSFSGYALPTFLLASLLLLVGVVWVSGGVHSTCGGLSDTFETWYGSWPNPNCFPGGTYPSWIGKNFQTSPTGFPTIDSAIHGQWWLVADNLRRLIFPAIAVAYTTIASVLRFVRNSMLEVMNLDFIRTARSKGVPEANVIRRHAGRNSLNVTVTVIGLTFAFFIGGFPIIEDVFHLYGIGLILTYSIQEPRDYGLIFGSTLLFTIIVVLANIIVDVLYAYLDPRVRLG